MKGGNSRSTSWEVVTAQLIGPGRPHEVVYGVYDRLAVEGKFQDIGAGVSAAAVAIESAVGGEAVAAAGAAAGAKVWTRNARRPSGIEI